MKKRMLFYDPTMTENSRIELNEYRKTGKYSDIELRTPNGHSYKVHKVVLSLSCPFFEKNINTSDKVLKLEQNINEADMDRILEYLYMGQVDISAENAKTMYDRSGEFMLYELQNFCAKTMMKNVNEENCMEFLRHGIERFNYEIRAACLVYIADNIEIFFDNHLLELSFSEVLVIVTSKTKLPIRQEELFNVVLKWTKADFEKRQERFMEIIEKLNFSRITNECIMQHNILNDAIFHKHKSFKKLITTLLNDERTIDLSEEEDAIKAYKKQAILADQKNIYVVCNSSVDKLDFDGRKRMRQFTFDNKKLWGCAAVGYQNNIFITGGGGCDTELKNHNFEVYDCRLGSTKLLPAIKISRFHRLAMFDAKIYACGGYGSAGAVEIYDIASCKWNKGPEMNEHKYDFALSSRGDCLYAVGGYVNATHMSDSVERLDIREGDWYIVSKTPVENFRTKAVLLDNAMYCIDVNSTGRIYDVRFNKWRETLISSDGIKNGGKSFWWCFDVVNLNDQIFGIFQNSDDPQSNTTWKTYKYDCIENSWMDLKRPLQMEAFADINLCVL